jgi:hypothetical protein
MINTAAVRKNRVPLCTTKRIYSQKTKTKQKNFPDLDLP